MYSQYIVINDITVCILQNIQLLARLSSRLIGRRRRSRTIRRIRRILTVRRTQNNCLRVLVAIIKEKVEFNSRITVPCYDVGICALSSALSFGFEVYPPNKFQKVCFFVWQPNARKNVGTDVVFQILLRFVLYPCASIFLVTSFQHFYFSFPVSQFTLLFRSTIQIFFKHRVVTCYHCHSPAKNRQSK